MLSRLASLFIILTGYPCRSFATRELALSFLAQSGAIQVRSRYDQQLIHATIMYEFERILLWVNIFNGSRETGLRDIGNMV